MVSVVADKRKAFQFPNSFTLSAFLFNLLLDQVSEFHLKLSSNNKLNTLQILGKTGSGPCLFAWLEVLLAR